jgi:hypothetical protein
MPFARQCVFGGICFFENTLVTLKRSRASQDRTVAVSPCFPRSLVVSADGHAHVGLHLHRQRGRGRLRQQRHNGFVVTWCVARRHAGTPGCCIRVRRLDGLGCCAGGALWKGRAWEYRWRSAAVVDSFGKRRACLHAQCAALEMGDLPFDVAGSLALFASRMIIPASFCELHTYFCC